MTLQYILAGGQLKIDKQIFARELLIPGNPIHKLLGDGAVSICKKPKISKTDGFVLLDYNDSSDIILDEGFFDLFKKMKEKYKDKVAGRVVIRITALSSYYVTLNLNSEDGRIFYDE